METCVISTYVYGLGRLALTERREKLQRAEELREEIGMKRHPRTKVAGMGRTHERMSEERLTKRARKTEEAGRRRGRPKLRWRDSVYTDLETGVNILLGHG